jgi:predicted dehydrogenase
MLDVNEQPQLRVALVGYGLSGSVFHAPLIAACAGLRLLSVVTSNHDRQQQAAEDNPGIQVLERLDDLWTRAADYDLVVVASPTGTHVAVGLAALEAGLPVVVDKPMAPSATEAARLVHAAEQRRLMLSVFHNRRWDGDTLTVRQLLAQGAVGAVVRFESRFERWRPAIRKGAWRDRAVAEEGGGVMLDLGSHIIDQALDVFGPAVRVYADVRTLRDGAMAEDDVLVALEHGGGVRSHLWASLVAAAPGPRVKLLGLGGGYEKHGLDVQEDQLRAGGRPGDQDWGIEPPQSWGRLVTVDGDRPVKTERGAWERYYDGIAEALRTGNPPPVDGRSALAVVEVIDAARRSSQSGKVIAVAGVPDA